FVAGDGGGGGGGGRGRGRGRGGPFVFRPSSQTAAVPVRVEPVSRRQISQYLESNGILEAENEVDIVARVSGPIVELKVEEGMEVAKDRLLARIDDREYKNQVASATVGRKEAKLLFERAQEGWDSQVISREEYDLARTKLEAAETVLESAQIQFDYTEIRAPFGGLIVIRYIKQAEYVVVNAQLFRISDFNPLLCPIQVPEKELRRLRVGQRAYINVEAFPEEKFAARVLRVSPVVDAATGTFKVTLEADGQKKLRPGMFASVFLETDVHENALVIAKAALVLDSIGDTVFISANDVAARKEVKLGFRGAAFVEVLEGLEEGDQLIVLGQEGLSDGTPVTLLGDKSAETAAADGGPESGPGDVRGEGPDGERPGRGRSGGPGGRRGGRRGMMSPEMRERIQNASPEELEQIKKVLRERGVPAERIDASIERIRSRDQ
ncbi:MAG: efflux RND transporter periplasmic adaptor subunit, partial [Planctomycetota bacterium]|nr:efflux RND transporter periplasmic adaptor subunit [Planctomycetota bacterium]